MKRVRHLTSLVPYLLDSLVLRIKPEVGLALYTLFPWTQIVVLDIDSGIDSLKVRYWPEDVTSLKKNKS
jgi:hypothetical protein